MPAPGSLDTNEVLNGPIISCHRASDGNATVPRICRDVVRRAVCVC